MTYRKDIDGLRAIAVLLVLLFHCQFAGFAGGYVGVDAFFVISGFLVTGIMLEDLKAGRFRFKSFYIRRVRRLLPALAATILFTLLGATLIMTPEHLRETATSAIFTAISLANLHFAMADSYFGAASEIKPLLHTWSLSVEEQFYVAWPVALVVLYRLGGLKGALIGVLLGCVMGLALSEYWIERNAKQAYFLPMFRMYQFLAGAALVFLPARRLPASLEEAGLGLGFLILIGSAMAFDGTTPFPGLYGLVPTVGTLLILLCGRAAKLGQVLTVRPMVWMGHVSYSVYLVHWPVTVFWRYLSADPFSFVEKLVLLGLSIGLGAVMYSYVETPFRLHRAQSRTMSWKQMMPPLGALAALALAAFGLRITDGLPQRMALSPEHQDYAQLSKFHFLQDYENGILQIGAGQSGERVLIFGDSMMQNYVPALMQLPRFAQAQVTVISRGGCVMATGAVRIFGQSPDTDCIRYRTAVADLNGSYDMVLWAQNWDSYGDTLHWEQQQGHPLAAFEDDVPDFAGWQAGVNATLDHLEQLSSRIVLFGPQYDAGPVPHVLERIGPLAPLGATGAEVAKIGHADQPNRAGIMAGFEALAIERPAVTLIDPKALICSQGPCRFSDGPLSYYMDPVHHTIAATPYLVTQLSALFP